MRPSVLRLIFLTFIFIAIGYVSSPGQNPESNSYIVVFLTPSENSDLDENEQQVIENNHLRNISKLFESKILANAGPFEGGGEMMLLNLGSRNKADSILGSDPLIQQKLATSETLTFEIRTGGICDAIFPYEMTTYNFVRFSSTNQIASYKTNSDYDMQRLHKRYLEELISTGMVILEGTFNGNDGGILIYKGSSTSLNLSLDPAIKEGYLIAEHKTIWLNRGSFCDN